MGSIPPSGGFYSGNATVLGSAYTANSATGNAYAIAKRATQKPKPQHKSFWQKIKGAATTTFNTVCNTAGTVAPLLSMLA